MVTQQRFASDPWVKAEIVTPEMDWLGDEICRRTGRPRTAFGTKGDRFHLSGAHRSQAFLTGSPLATNRSYTVQPGLSTEQLRHVAGIDFTPATSGQMIAQSQRLYNAMRAGQLDEIREIYCNINGDKLVDGWDNVADRPITSDDSHLWHWHLSLDRRQCRNRALMERILSIALGATPPTSMPEEADELNTAQDGALTVAWMAADALLDMQPTTDGGAKARPMEFVRQFKELRADVQTLLERPTTPAPAPIDYDQLAEALLRRFAAGSRPS